jgi:hypothetical protein
LHALEARGREEIFGTFEQHDDELVGAEELARAVEEGALFGVPVRRSTMPCSAKSVIAATTARTNPARPATNRPKRFTG